MSQIEEKEEKLKIKVEYGYAYCSFVPVKIPQPQHEHLVEMAKKTKLHFKREMFAVHRSGRRSDITVPEPFKKLLMVKMKGKNGSVPVEFTMATYRYEEPREVFNILYAIAIKHKSDNFRRSVGREMVTGRIKRYLKDKYVKEIKQLFAGTLPNGKQESISWVTEKPDCIHIEQEAIV